ncbi:MAG: hypothetical protein JW728_04825 [Candidatus Aureabacteria bacterium]|nr:hypothetical protein [Candidatus Auribacterota bacterium]
MKKICFLCIFLLASLVFSQQLDISNNSFESGDFQEWVCYGHWDITEDKDDVYSGKYAAVIDVSKGPSNIGQWESNAVFQDIGHMESREFVVRAYVKTESLAGAKAFLRVEALNEKGNIIKSWDSEKISGSAKYKEMSVSDRAPRNTVKLRVLGYIINEEKNPSGMAFFDEFLSKQIQI